MALVFISYSHADEQLRNELEKHLKALQRQGLIETWHDRRIVAGEELHHEIDEKLNAADVILLLISPDFIASDYCYDLEMQQAMQRHNRKEATVIPVILRPCLWEDTPFSKLMVTPTDAKPVVKFANQDEAFLEITKAIKSALKKNAGKESNPTVTFQPGSDSSPSMKSVREVIRSSNLAVKKVFTDQDRDQFLDEAFKYTAKFFEGSLEELQKRNPELSTRFQQIDARRFTASAYRNGKKLSECTIFLSDRSSFGSCIAFSSGITTSSNSMNGSLSVEDDDSMLFLKPMMSFNKDERLTIHGGAEHFWDQFISPLQR